MKKIFLTLFFFSFLNVVFSQQKPINGLKESNANCIAFINAEIQISPDKKIKKGTILIKDNKIVFVGKKTKIPNSAKKIDCKGKIIIPAFIDPYSNLGLSHISKKKPGSIANNKSSYWNNAIHPETKATDHYLFDKKSINLYQKMGYGTVLTHNHDGIVRGTGTLISLHGESLNEQLLIINSANFYSFEKGSSKQKYPSSQMGSIALLRQSLYDLMHYKSSPNKNTNISLSSWEKTISLPAFFKVKNALEILRAEKISNEFNINFLYVGGGDEYQIANKLIPVNEKLVIPLNYPKAYKINDPYLAKKIPLKKLKHWELAPSNAASLNQESLVFSFTSFGIKNPIDFWNNIRKTISRGISKEKVLASLTTIPAKQIGVSFNLGTLEKGKFASFCIYEKDPFLNKSPLYSSWIMGKECIVGNPKKYNLTGEYNLSLNKKSYKISIEKK